MREIRRAMSREKEAPKRGRSLALPESPRFAVVSERLQQETSMPELPSGTVTFLMTDVEDSTRLTHRAPEAMNVAMARHDELAEAAVAANEGVWFKPRGEGDSLFLVFARASDALAAALDLQRALQKENWALPTPLRVRMALHTGEVQPQNGDYRGLTPNLCARLREIAHGGQILLSQATYQLVSGQTPPDVTLWDLGARPLRDLPPERVYEARHPDLPPSPDPVTPHNHNLPRQLTSFIGREKERAEIQQRLTQAALLTLTGAGGCGKTRLALQVASEALSDYQDGARFVELASLQDASLLDKSLAAAVGVKERTDTALLEALIDHLRDKSLLLVLDNCEHLLGACQRLMRRLLQDCPNLTILATSREPLTIPGEKQFRLAPLPAPERDSAFEILSQNECVRLFTERAQEADGTFELTKANIGCVTGICRSLDGIPLAIELAAKHVTMLTVKQIETQLKKHIFRLLQSQDVSGLERHQTMEAAIDWSYNRLGEEAQRMLRQLSVFVGGWTLEAAADVCLEEGADAEEALPGLTKLVNISLVNAEGQGDVKRYRLLETIRQYSLAKLEVSGEADSVRVRHLDYFLDFARQAEHHLTGRDQAAWLDNIECELDNLRAAWEWTIDSNIRLELSASLWRFWSGRGYLKEGRARLEGALAQSRNAHNLTKAKALNGLGVLLQSEGNPTVVRQYLDESLAIRRAENDVRGIAESLGSLGSFLREQGEVGPALACFEEALTLREQLGDQWGLAASYNNLGIMRRDYGDYDGALRYYEQALNIYKSFEDTARIATLLSNMADVETKRKNMEAAQALFTECLTKLRELGNRPHESIVLNNLGELECAIGQLTEAKRHFLESMHLRWKLGDRVGIAYPLSGIAHLANLQGDHVCAACLLSASQALRVRSGFQLPDSEQKLFDEIVAEARAHLDAEAFTNAMQRGESMSIEEAMKYAEEA